MVLEHSSGSGFQMVVIIWIPIVYSRYKKFRVHLYVRYVYVYVFATDKRGIKKLKFQDENFGVLEVDNKMVLFDTCDVWLDPITTVDKVRKGGAFHKFRNQIRGGKGIVVSSL